MATIKDLVDRIKNFRTKKNLEYDEVDGVKFSRPEIPVIVEKRNKEYVLYGLNNDYPKLLNELLNTSAIHNAIVEGKSEMMAGTGFLINGAKDEETSNKNYQALPLEIRAAYDALINNNGDGLHGINKRMCKDYQKLGAMSAEITWSTDFSRISKIKYLNCDNIRSGKMLAGKVASYWYCRDWENENKNKPVELKVFNPDERLKPEKERSRVQIYYAKRGTLEYYGEPSYKGALSWIKIDSQMGLFHLSNIENGFNPSLVFKFYKKPGSPEKKQEILENINAQWSGAKNTGKGLVFFSDGKELSPDVEPVEVSNLDKQYIALADQAVQQILSGHKVTSPMLFGVAIPGKLGSSATELEISYRIFDNSVIEPDREEIEKFDNLLLKANQTPVVITVEKFNPLKQEEVDTGSKIVNSINSLSPLVANKVLEKMTDQEIRALIGLGLATQPVTPPTQ